MGLGLRLGILRLVKAGRCVWSNSKFVLRVSLFGLSCHRGINKPTEGTAENGPFYKLFDLFIFVSFLLYTNYRRNAMS